MSPTIWTLFSLHLAKKLSLVAPSSLWTYFADDLLLQWEFLDDLAFRFIPQEIAAVLTLLRREGMCISVNKTVILRSWWGSRVHDVTRPFLTKILHKRYFRVALDSGEVVHLPLVDSHKYLGMFLSYKNYEALSLKYRLQQSWVAFNRLTKALKNRSLPVRLRLRLYNSVCLATATYGLTCIGLSAEGRAKFRATVVRQLRMVVGDHSHVTGHTNVEVLGKYGIVDPLLQVDDRIRQRIDKARTNLFLPYSAAVARRWSRLVDTSLSPDLEQPPKVFRHTEQAPVTCEICHATFQNPAMLKHHHTTVHAPRTAEEQHSSHRQVMRTRSEDHLKYCVGGMPTCRMCGHQFAAWPAFMSHHNRKCCPVLHQGAEQPKHLKELPPEPTPLAEDVALLEQAAASPLPQVADLVHQKGRAHHCPICGIWVTQTRFLASHMNQQHKPVKQHIASLKERLKSVKVEWKNCPYCETQHDRGLAGCPVFLTAAILKHCPPYATDSAEVVGTGGGPQGHGSVERVDGGPSQAFRGTSSETRAGRAQGRGAQSCDQSAEDHPGRKRGKREGWSAQSDSRHEREDRKDREDRGDDRLPQGSEEHRPDADNGRHPPGGSTSALSSRQCIHPLHGDLSSPGHLASAVRPRTVLEREEGEGPSLSGLLGCLLKQIELRIEKLGTDEELRKVAKDSKLLSEADCFNYLEYDAKAKNYQVKEGRLAIPRKEALQLVRELQEFILIPRVVHRFHASRKHTAEVTAAALPFMFEISNRGEAAPSRISATTRSRDPRWCKPWPRLCAEGALHPEPVQLLLCELTCHTSASLASPFCCAIVS